MYFVRQITLVVAVVFLAGQLRDIWDSFYYNQTNAAQKSPRFILRLSEDDVPSSSKDRLRVEALVDRAEVILEEASRNFQAIAGLEPGSNVILRFLSPEKFKQEAFAPDWATGVYYRGEILVPLDEMSISGPVLVRTLRHEYVHAAIDEISKSRCPAWLNEGLAQLFEGKSPERVNDTLLTWRLGKKLIPLDELGNGFTNIEKSSAATAYAESLFSVNILIQKFGYTKLGVFLGLLANGEEVDMAFSKAFSLTVEQFFSRLSREVSLPES